MIRRDGHYHDGCSSQSRAVEVRFYADGLVSVEGDGISLRVPLAELRVSPRLGRTPRVLMLPDGASCELPDDDALDRHLAAARQAQRTAILVARLERHWLAVLLALGAALVCLALGLRFGVPALARAAAFALPVRLEEKLAEGALAALDETHFGASRLPEATRDELRRLLEMLAAGQPIEPAPRLMFRDGGSAGANAFALPGGVVVVTDQLVTLASRTDELAGVLAHELGHGAHRHALRALLQQAGVGVLLATALGDVGSVSSLAAALPVLLVELHYSREFEREADAYAVDLLERRGLPLGDFAAMLERLAAEGAGAGVPEYLSTHPDTRERLRAIRAASPP